MQKKYRKLVDKCSELLNENPELIIQFVDFFYSKLRDDLVNIKDLRFQIEKLGHIYVSKRKLESLIKLGELKLNDLKTENAKNNLENRLKLEKENLIKLSEIIKERDEFYKERNNLKKSLEKQKENN